MTASAGPRLAGLALAALVSLTVLVGMAVVVWRAGSFAAQASWSEGVILDQQPHPSISFTASDGIIVQFRQNGDTPGAVGSRVPVAFDPTDPAGTARVGTFWALWGTSIRLMPLALIALACAVLSGWGMLRS